MKGKIKTKACLLGFAAVMLTGCNFGQPEPEVSEFFAMDTYISISAYGEKAEEALRECRSAVSELDSLLSATNAESEIYRINQGAGKEIEVSRETAKIISAALSLCEMSKGALDISLYPISREWGFIGGEYKIPDENTLSELLKNTGYEKISCTENTVTLPEGFGIDLGAVAKGYAGDKAVSLLKEKGITSALVNLGGNIALVGTKPDGTPWNIGIQNPFDDDGYACTVKASGSHIVTSGNYQRYFEENGSRYCHIIDPKTGRPADSGLASVTVISDSGILCDALSTALFVMGSEKAAAFWRENGGFEMIMVTADKKVLATEGVFDSCTACDLGEISIIRK